MISMAALFALPLSALGMDLDRTVHFNIAAQDLGTALLQFSQQTRIQIVINGDIRSEATRGITGQHAIKDALSELLAPAGLRYQVASEDSITIAKGSGSHLPAASYVPTNYVAHEGPQLRLAQAATPQHANSDQSANAEPTGKLADNVHEVVVTGSRIARSGFDTPTPTTTISSEQIQQTGLVDTGQIMMQNPQISVGLGATNDTFNRDLGSSFINLRGLGENRTLVLIDGRRRVSGSREGSQVDLASIPPGMIDSIEIITGGASAVYGADAVSGVVNVKLKRDFEGLEASITSGLSQEGGAESYSANLLGGGFFAEGRGHASFGVSAQESKVLRYTDRDFAFGPDAVSFVNNPANTGPSDGIADRLMIYDPHTIGSAYEPTFVIAGQRYLWDDGGLVTFDPSNCYNNASACAGGPYGYNNRERTLRNPRTGVSAISNIRYDLTPSVTFLSGFDFSYARTATNGQSYFDTGMSLARANPTIPDEVAALMDANGLTRLTVGTVQEDRFGNKQYENTRYTFTVNMGFEGKIGERFDWETFAQYGRRTQNYQISNTRIEARFFEALNAIADPLTGQTVCASATARAAGCIPVDVFSGRAATEQEKAYWSYALNRKVENEQTLAGFQITGELFELPAGPLGFAFGGEYRKDTLSASDDGLAARGELYRTDNGARPVNASTDVTEAFIEAVVPVLKDLPFVQMFEVEGAVRFSDYSSIGSTTAWKLGAGWAPIEDVRFRVTRSESVRAPNIIELFGPESRGTLNITQDPCDVSSIALMPNREANCRALGVPVGWIDPAASLALLTVLGGNQNLTEETSNSWTVGMVLTPSFLPRLRLSVDWWTIEIDDAIQTLDGNTIVDNCVDSPSLNNLFCPLVSRGNLIGINDPYAISRIDLRQVNVGRLSAEGVDVSVAYHFQLAELLSTLNGSLTLGLSLVYLAELEELVDATDPTSLLIKDGEFKDPSWRGLFSVGYRLDKLSSTWSVRYVGAASLDRQRSREFNVYDVPSKFYHDLFVGYELFEKTDLSFSVNNVMNQKPPQLPLLNAGAGDASLYDNIGRYFVLGLKKSF
jgi:outer membrane receptor protein involved in Fe transport